jgi:hypothetical protein
MNIFYKQSFEIIISIKIIDKVFQKIFFIYWRVFILKVKIIFWRRVARSVFQIPQEENGNILGLPYYGKKYFMKR